MFFVTSDNRIAQMDSHNKSPFPFYFFHSTNWRLIAKLFCRSSRCDTSSLPLLYLQLSFTFNFETSLKVAKSQVKVFLLKKKNLLLVQFKKIRGVKFSSCKVNELFFSIDLCYHQQSLQYSYQMIIKCLENTMDTRKKLILKFF